MNRVIPYFLLVLAAQAAPPFTARVSRSTIAVGESAAVTCAGGQPDVPSENTIDVHPGMWASAVHAERIDRTRFAVKGLAPCDCVLTFSDGKSKAAVKIRVVKK